MADSGRRDKDETSAVRPKVVPRLKTRADVDTPEHSDGIRAQTKREEELMSEKSTAASLSLGYDYDYESLDASQTNPDNIVDDNKAASARTEAGVDTPEHSDGIRAEINREEELTSEKSSATKLSFVYDYDYESFDASQTNPDKVVEGNKTASARTDASVDTSELEDTIMEETNKEHETVSQEASAFSLLFKVPPMTSGEAIYDNNESIVGAVTDAETAGHSDEDEYETASDEIEEDILPEMNRRPNELREGHTGAITEEEDEIEVQLKEAEDLKKEKDDLKLQINRQLNELKEALNVSLTIMDDMFKLKQKEAGDLKKEKDDLKGEMNRQLNEFKEALIGAIKAQDDKFKLKQKETEDLKKEIDDLKGEMNRQLNELKEALIGAIKSQDDKFKLKQKEAEDLMKEIDDLKGEMNRQLNELKEALIGAIKAQDDKFKLKQKEAEDLMNEKEDLKGEMNRQLNELKEALIGAIKAQDDKFKLKQKDAEDLMKENDYLKGGVEEEMHKIRENYRNLSDRVSDLRKSIKSQKQEDTKIWITITDLKKEMSENMDEKIKVLQRLFDDRNLPENSKLNKLYGEHFSNIYGRLQSMEVKQHTVESQLADMPGHLQRQLDDMPGHLQGQLDQLLRQLEDKQGQRHAELSFEGTSRFNEQGAEVNSQLMTVKAFLERTYREHFSNIDGRLQSMEAKQHTVEPQLAGLPGHQQGQLDPLLRQLEDKQRQRHAELSNEGTSKLNELRAEVNSQLVTVKASLELLNQNLVSTAFKLQMMETLQNRVPIGFTARTTGCHLTTTHPIMTRFTEVTFNEGGHYNPVTGLFTAPIAGIYVVNLTHTQSDEGEIFLNVVQSHRASELKTLIAYTRTCGKHSTSSDNAVVRMQEGDSLHVKVQHYSGNGQIWSPSCFSCFLIR